MKLLHNQTGESLPLMSRGNSHSLHNVIYPSQMSHRNPFGLRPLSKTHLVTELIRATLVVDAFGDAVAASVTASNGTGMAEIFNEQPGWSKDSIMEIAFGIVGTMLGVAAVWLGVHLYRELTPLFSRVEGWEMVEGGVVWIPTLWWLWLAANDRWVSAERRTNPGPAGGAGDEEEMQIIH
jgi:hypothetical protein